MNPGISARELGQDALEALMVYSPGEDITNADAARAFSVLNQMIDSWSNEALTCYALLEQSGVLIPGKSVYDVGPDGDFQVDRPLQIAVGPGSAFLLDGLGNRYEVEPVTRDRWNMIPNISTITANVPNAIFYDPQFPVAKMNVYPVPNLPWTLFWNSYLPLRRFDDLATPVGLPAGYEKAIKSNLAIDLEPYYPQAVVKPSLLQQARESKANVKRTNIREVVATYDKEIVSRSQYSYNIYRGF